jgi:chromosome segregation ATPase
MLPEPTNETAEALQQVIDSLSDGHEAIVRPLEPLPWRSAEAFDVYQRLGLLESHTDRRLQFLQELIAQQTFDLQHERTERQGEIDALTSRLLSEIAEVRSAQSADATELASAQADIRMLEDRIAELEELLEESEPEQPSLITRINAVLRPIALISLGLYTAQQLGIMSPSFLDPIRSITNPAGVSTHLHPQP